MLLASVTVIVLSHLGFFASGAQSTRTKTTLQVVQTSLNRYAADHDHYPLSQEITTPDMMANLLSAYVQKEFLTQSSLHFVSYESAGDTFTLKLSAENEVWRVTPDLIQVESQ